MLAVIVFYLSYFGSIDGMYVEKKCLPENSDCLVDADCCSNYCLVWASMTSGQCSAKSEPKKNVIRYLTDEKQCFNDQNCYPDKCSKDPGADVGTSISNPTEAAFVKNNFCFEFGHICSSSHDCCSRSCRIAQSYFATVILFTCR